MNDKRREFFHMDEIEAHLSLFASDERLPLLILYRESGD
jgi:hypothetical protein